MPRLILLLLSIAFFHLGSPYGSSAQEQTRKLLDGAKKEGALVWYMSASIEDAKAILLAFNKKYPNIKTDFFAPARRGSSTA